MATFQDKLNKILRESKNNPVNTQVLNEDQKDSPVRVHPEHGQEVTKGDITGNTVRVDANGPIPTGLASTLKTQPGDTTGGPTGHIPTNGDLPNGGKPSYGLGEEAEEDEDKKVDEGKEPPPFAKKGDKKDEKDGDEKSDDKKDEKKLDEEGPAGATLNKKDGEKFNEESDEEEGDKTEKVNEESEDDDDKDDEKAVKEATEKLFAGETISEALKEKTAAIFEETLSNRIKEFRKLIQERYTKKLNGRVEEIREELSHKVDGHLDLVVENWVKTHEVALESAIKAQLMEEFIGGLKSLFEEHYIELPENKVDVVAEMAGKVTELEGKLNEQIEANVELNKKVRLHEKAEIFTKVSKGLTATQVEKLRSLSESVEYTTAEQYESALANLKPQTNGPAAPKTQAPKPLVEQTLEQNSNAGDTSKKVGAVKDVLARMAKK